MANVLNIRKYVSREGEPPAEPLRYKLGRSLALPKGLADSAFQK